MSETQTYIRVENQNASQIGSSIEIQAQYEFGKNPIVLWSFKPDQSEDVYLYIERENLSTGSFESDENIYKAHLLSNTQKRVFFLDPTRKTRIHLEVESSQSTISVSDYLIFDPQPNIVQINNSANTAEPIYTFFNSSYGLIINQKQNQSAIVNGSVAFLRPENYNINNIQSLNLEYQIDGEDSWAAVEIKIPSNATQTDESYSFNFENLPIFKPKNRSIVRFRLVLEAGGSYGIHYSELETLSFTDYGLPLNPFSQTQAALRYEITTTISESYFTTVRQDESEPELRHYFNDELKSKSIEFSRFYLDVFNDEKNSKGFIFQATDNPEGFFYPACISEILPCISLMPSDGSDNSEIKLSWKIIDNFFDYTFFTNKLRVKTNSLIVSAQCKDSNGTYQTLKADIKLEESDYTNNFFVIVLKRSEVNASLFNSISLSDNNSDRVRIKIQSHEVTFTSPVRVGDTKTFTGKLLLPPKWTHILYDGHRDTNIDTEEELLRISLDSKSLRGIVLPEAGFKKSIAVQGWRDYGEDSTKTTKIFYKLTTQTKALYLDPIREGTIVYVQLPSSGLDDVFLIPPTLNLPSPNIDANGKQAEGEVVLNEYGKIAGVKITEPGYGYSMFKTEADKRTQTFVDYLPLVKSRYHIRSTNSNIAKETLVPQNASFSRLKASLSDGVKLNDPNGNNLSALNTEQQDILKEYLSRTGADVSSEEGVSEDDPYINDKDNSSNNVTIQSIDLEWYNISKLYADKDSSPLEDLNIYNLDTDANIGSVEDSKIKDEIEPAQVATDISNTDITLDGQVKKTADSSLYTLNELPVFTDASAASSVFNPTAGPPWLTLLPLDKRSDGAAAHGALPNMLTRGDSFFNRIVDGVNNLNKARLMLPSIWAIDLIEKRDLWLRDETSDPERITFEKSGEFETQTTVQSLIKPSNARGIGARVLRSVRKRNDDNRIESLELNQSMEITPMIHPWMEQAIPSFFTQAFNKKYLAFAVGRREECDRYVPFQENGFGVLNGCGTSIQIPPGTSVPEGRIVTTSAELTFFNGGTISLTPNGSAEAFSFSYSNGSSRGNCNTYSCASQQDIDFDFRYSNMYPAILNIP
jgi:hypothetical protein